jgi:hypothetical protein
MEKRQNEENFVVIPFSFGSNERASYRFDRGRRLKINVTHKERPELWQPLRRL